MNRRNFIRNIAGAAAVLCVSQFIGCQSPVVKPNIIILYIDDLGWKDLGYMGSRFYETPQIDRLSRTGLTFTNAYANAPNCAPSRASLMTGMYTPRHGILTVGSSKRGESRLRKLIPIATKTKLDPEFITLPEALHGAGYASASMGKWHLGDDPETGPVGHGFDINIGGTQLGYTKSHFSPYKNDVLADGPEGEYLTDRLTEEALTFIADNQKGPFFLYLTHYAVHTPIQGKEGLREKYEGKPPSGGHFDPAYAAMIESVDQGVGKILDLLDSLDLRENTLIFFLSDNGGHGTFTSMQPLRGSKGMLYEGGIRVPLIISWPKQLEGSKTCDEPVIGMDIFPTILDVLDIPLPAGQPCDGKSLSPLLSDGQGGFERDTLFWHFPAYLGAYPGMDFPWRTTPAGAVRAGDWKLIEFFEDNILELYNLKDDIGESDNLIDRFPEKARELHDKLVSWRSSVGATVPTDRNPEYTGKASPDKKEVRAGY